MQIYYIFAIAQIQGQGAWKWKRQRRRKSASRTKRLLRKSELPLPLHSCIIAFATNFYRANYSASKGKALEGRRRDKAHWIRESCCGRVSFRWTISFAHIGGLLNKWQTIDLVSKGQGAWRKKRQMPRRNALMKKRLLRKSKFHRLLSRFSIIHLRGTNCKSIFANNSNRQSLGETTYWWRVSSVFRQIWWLTYLLIETHTPILLTLLGRQLSKCIFVVNSLQFAHCMNTEINGTNIPT